MSVMSRIRSLMGGTKMDASAVHMAPAAVAGGAFDGADRISREMATWAPPLMSADAEILPSKGILDARGRSISQNDPLVSNGVEITKNGVVGTKFVLNSKPNGDLLGFDEDAVDEVQREIEALFDVYAHSDDCYVDASGKLNLTDIVRIATGAAVITGEFLATFEWLDDQPFKTALQLVDADRLSNPNGTMDTPWLSGGVEKDIRGRPVAYHIQTRHPSDYWVADAETAWKRVPARKPWGRRMVLHVFDQTRPDQSRGVAKMVAALREMRMTRRFQDVALQNAVVQAMFAATIESDRGPLEAYQALGMETAATNPDQMAAEIQGYTAAYLNAALAYGKSGNVARLDGAMVPHLFPGTKLNIQKMGDGTLGTEFENSLIRKIAAALGVSYEEMARDLTKVSYSGAMAAMSQTAQTMMAVKRATPDKVATAIFKNWLEEVVNAGMITSLPAAAKRQGWLYEGQNLNGLARCSWIGAARGVVDEDKAAKAAERRLAMGLTTMEAEAARMGDDWREVAKQRAREIKNGVVFPKGSKK